MTSEPSSQQSSAPLEAGRIVGERYLVGEVLGDGGMGVVHAGTHLFLGTPVAIKVIHSDLKNDAEAVQRFLNEARAAAQLKGEHIARVFDVGVLESGEPYLVMEQLEGMSLDRYLTARGTLAETEAVDIVLQVCEGLAEAHAAGLVHRDIKPANLFLAQRPDGQSSVKILDFGIAKRLDSASPALTDPGRSLGSPWYMSPEQMLTPASVDARSDVWSLGVLLFELLTARLPFEGESVPQVCANVLATAPLRISHCRGDLAPELDTIVLCCLEKELSRRFDSVTELAQALSPFASVPLAVAPALPLPLHAGALALDDSKPSVSEPVFTAYQPRRPRRLAVALMVVVPLLLLAGWLQYRDPSLAAHAIRAALGTSFHRAAGQASASDADSTALDTRDGPTLLQYLHGARAVPERVRPEVAAQRAAAWLAGQQARARAATNEEWQRAQAVKRLNDEENKYGL